MGLVLEMLFIMEDFCVIKHSDHSKGSQALAGPCSHITIIS